MAFGNHWRRFLVRHRQVTKRFPRAHLGSNRNDDLRFVLHLGRIRATDELRAQELLCDLVADVKFIASHHDAVFAKKLTICDYSHFN
jgi:hypothetical protein